MKTPAEITELERKAAQFPSMGGREIGPHLRAAARDHALPGTAITEIGCWLGAGTAQLALGLLERPDGGSISLHCFDNFRALESEVPKAGKAGLEIRTGQDTLPIVKGYMESFGVPCVYHQGPIEDQAWDGGPISVCVFDAPKGSKLFYSTLKKFGPSWIPGKTLVFFMDYYFWQKNGIEDHKCQTELVEGHPECFSPAERLHGSSVLVRYLAPFDFAGLPRRRL